MSSVEIIWLIHFPHRLQPAPNFLSTHSGLLSNYNIAELIAQVRQRDSAYNNLKPATASHNSLPEAERGIVTTVTETNQNQVGIHGRAHLAAATDTVATDDRVWNWRKSTKLCLQFPRGNDAGDQRVVCNSAGIAHSNE